MVGLAGRHARTSLACQLFVAGGRRGATGRLRQDVGQAVWQSIPACTDRLTKASLAKGGRYVDISKVSEHAFTVLSNEPVAEGIWRMLFESAVAKELAPGQFMNFTVPGDGSHILKLPLSFAQADAGTKQVEILYAVVGEGTRRLSQMSLGDSSTLLGPCGRGWWLPAHEGRALLVAGGIGFPPVEAVARMLAAAGVAFDLVAGARTAALLLADRANGLAGLGGEDARVICCTDDGTSGRAGFVTGAMGELMAERAYSQVYTCGATPMMAAVARFAATQGVACQASLERMMGCGFGACACCNVALVKGGYALCCQDGPVFDATEVVW